MRTASLESPPEPYNESLHEDYGYDGPVIAQTDVDS